MPTISFVRKEATPEQLGWRARIAAHEPTLVKAFLAWVATLHDHITASDVAQAVSARSVAGFDHVLQAVTFRPVLTPVAGAEAAREYADLFGHRGGMRLSFDLHDPNFVAAVQEHEARLVREVTTETKRAIANMIERGYRDGVPPIQLAPEIREAVGLTARQAQAVMNFAEAQRKTGAKPTVVGDRAMRYAGQMRTRRARTIARTETARAAVTGRLQSYDQAASHGLFDQAEAQLQWSSVQDDPTEICATLDGTRVPFAVGTFDGLLPPVHPCCRCSVHLVLDR